MWSAASPAAVRWGSQGLSTWLIVMLCLSLCIWVRGPMIIWISFTAQPCLGWCCGWGGRLGSCCLLGSSEAAKWLSTHLPWWWEQQNGACGTWGFRQLSPRRVGLVLDLLPPWQLAHREQVVWWGHSSTSAPAAMWYYPVVPVRQSCDHWWWFWWAIKQEVFPCRWNECPLLCPSDVFHPPALSARSLGLAPRLGFAVILLGWLRND